MKAGADLSAISLETKIFLCVLSVLCPSGWTAPAATWRCAMHETRDRCTRSSGKVNLILGAFQTCLQERDGRLGVTVDLGPPCKAQQLCAQGTPPDVPPRAVLPPEHSSWRKEKGELIPGSSSHLLAGLILQAKAAILSPPPFFFFLSCLLAEVKQFLGKT